MQTFIIFLAVGFSLCYLGWKFWKQFFDRKSSCEGCALHQTLTKDQQDYGKRSTL